MDDNKPIMNMAKGGHVPVNRQEQLAKYRAEIGAAQEFMETEGLHDKWRRFVRMYAESMQESEDPAIDCIDVPIGFSNVNVLRSALTVNQPKFTVSPRNKKSYMPAVVTEEILNYEWYHQDFQAEIQEATDDLLIMGNLWLKVGYDLELGPARSEVQSLAFSGRDPGLGFGDFNKVGFDEQFDAAVETMERTIAERPSMGRHLPARSEIARQLREAGHAIITDEAWLHRVSPFDMLVDPSATSMKNAQWVAQRRAVRKEMAEKEKSWDSRVRTQLSTGQKSIARDPDGTERKQSPNSTIHSGQPGGQPQEWVIVWEFYDLHDGTKCTFADEAGDDFLIKPEGMPFPFGHPFIYVGNYSVPDRFYHIGELERIESLQIELNKTRSSLINDRKALINKFVVNEDFTKSADSTIFDLLASDQNNAFTSVKVPNGRSLADVVFRLPQPTLDPNLYNNGATIQNDMNEVSGITDFQRGSGGTGATTATEASIINDGALARMKEKQGKIEKMMRDAARRIVMLKLKYMQSRKAIRISLGAAPATQDKFRSSGLGEVSTEELAEAGLEFIGDDLFIEYGRQEIAGEFDLVVEAGSSTAFNETQRRRSVQEMLATVGPFLQQDKIDVDALLEYVLRYGFGVPNASQFLKKPELQPQPQGQGQPGGVPYDPGGNVASITGGVLQPSGGVPPSQAAPPPQFQG